MIPVKRLEIVVDSTYSPRIVKLLGEHGLTGWTLLPGASGAGDRGPRLADDINGVMSNHVILTTCPPESLEALMEELRALLVRYGGMCLISDAHWLRH